MGGGGNKLGVWIKKCRPFCLKKIINKDQLLDSTGTSPQNSVIPIWVKTLKKNGYVYS